MPRRLIAVTGNGFLVLIVFVASLSAQDYRAKLQGVVRDSTQAVVAGAKATLTNVNTGFSEVRETGSDGHYIFDLVEPGMYEVTVEAEGFQSFHQRNVSVLVRADVTVDAELAVGKVSDQVVVNEQINNLQFNTSTMDLTVDHEMVSDLPILARNPITLALLDPAVVNRFSTDRNPFYMWSSSSIDVGGPTAGKNDLLLDGAPLMMTNKGSYVPPMDAVQELTVQQNSVDAEFGNSAGGVFSLSLKSGTNEFHGTAYYFGRNPALNAVADAATHQPNEVRNHIWGGTLGNPLKKNKLFTFTAWEQWRTRTPRENIETVPTALERTGDFSKSRNAAGGLRIIYDPWTTQFDPATSTVKRTPFPGNVIPPDRIDPTAKRIMQDIWLPNNPGDDITGVNNFKETYYLGTNYWNFSNRTDWNITNKWRVFGRYSQFHNTIDEKHSVQSPAIPRWDGGAMYALNIAANSIYMLRSNLVLEVSGSYGSIHDDYDDPTGRMNSQTLASIWPNQWYTPYTKDLNSVYYPNMIIGDATFGHGFWWVEHPKNASFCAKMGQNLRKHDLKYGFEYRRAFGYISYPSPWTFNFGPDLTADTFIQPNTALSGSPYATFLLGALGSAPLGGAGDSVARYISPHQPRISTYGVFFQDDLKLNRRVTLNLGMRYEYSGAMTDANNRISRYLDLTSPIPEMKATPPSMPSAVTAIANIPYKWNGAWHFADSSHPAVYQTSKLGFMPRAGLAFKVNDKTVLRAGYARWVIPSGMTQPFQSSMPMSGYTATTTTAPSLQGIPGGVLSDPFPATNPLILPTGSSLGRYQNLGASASWEAQNFLTGVSDRINVSVQRQLPQQLLLDVTFFANLSHNLPYTLSLNQLDPQLSYTYKGLLSQSVANPFYQYLTPATFPGQLRNQSMVTVGSLLTMYPQYGTLEQLNTPGIKDKYYALQTRVQRRYSNGLAILWAYNFCREATQDWFNAPDQYANRFTYIDSNNPRHRMNIAGTYDLPFGKGRWLLSNASQLVNAILGGWSSSGIFMYVSGEYLRFGQLNVTGNPAIFDPTRDQYFNTSVFSLPTPYTPRTNPWQYPGVTGPHNVNLDATISKFFAVRERLRVEFRMEAYNATNSFMAKNPSTDINSSLFGRSTGQANIGRQIQYALRMAF